MPATGDVCVVGKGRRERCGGCGAPGWTGAAPSVGACGAGAPPSHLTRTDLPPDLLQLQITSEFGGFLDPVADKIMCAAMACGLAHGLPGAELRMTLCGGFLRGVCGWRGGAMVSHEWPRGCKG